MRSEQKQPGGGLANWNTESLPDGVYTLRLVLEDRTRGELSTYVVVTIGGGNIRATPTPTPTPAAPGHDIGEQ